MSSINKFILTAGLLVFHSSAYAQEVFQCTGPDGEKVFTFSPCADTGDPGEAAVLLEEPRAVPEAEVDEEVIIDRRIATLQEQLDAARQDYNAALAGSKGNTNEVTAAYDRISSEILDELMSLYQQKQQVAAR